MECVTTLLLAAGASRRFGRPKLLEPLPDGTPIAVASARRLRAAGAHCIAVVGRDHDALRKALEAEQLVTIVCANSEDGLGASLSCGVRAAADAHGWLIALADMPFVQPATIRALAARLTPENIVAPLHAGQRGNPVGFGRRFRDELLALNGDRGGRDLLTRHAAALEVVACDDAGVLRDIDRVEDLRMP